MNRRMQSVADYLLKEIGSQKNRLFLWIPVCIGIGIILYFSKTVTPPPSIAIIACANICIGALICRYFYNRNSHPLVNLSFYYICLVFGFIFLGLCLAAIRDYTVKTPVLKKDTFAEIEGTIESIYLLPNEKAKQIILKDITIIDDKDIQFKTVRLRSYHFKGNDWESGDRVRLTGRFLAPREPVIPDGFDFREKARFDGLSATGFTIRDAVLLEKSTGDHNILNNIRQSIAQSIYQNMDNQTAGVALALLTGELSGISKDDKEAMRASGLAHILAISGLHIGLVAGCVFFFIRLILSAIPNLALYVPIKKWAALLAIITAFSYMVLAGATVPTVRAFIMTALVLTAVILDRSAINLRLVALAAIIVMIMTPEAILGPSFQLSFAAVTALIAFYQGAGRRWLTNANAFHPLWKPFYYLTRIIATTIIATLATAPFSIAFFNRLAVYSVLSNILAMPLMTLLVMPFGLLSIILMPFNAADLIWPAMEFGLKNILIIAQAIADYEYADIYLPSFNSIQMALVGFSFIILVLWQGHLRWIGAVIITSILIANSYQDFHRIYINDKADAVVMINTKTNEYFQIGKPSRYVKGQWLQTIGIAPDTSIPALPLCDDFVCFYNTGAKIIAYVKNPLGVDDACKHASIVIAGFPISKYRCADKVHIIDRFDVWREGVHMIDVKIDGLNIQTVRSKAKADK